MRFLICGLLLLIASIASAVNVGPWYLANITPADGAVAMNVTVVESGGQTTVVEENIFADASTTEEVTVLPASVMFLFSTLSSGDDTYVSNSSLGESVYALGGDDYVELSAGANMISGFSGNDVLIGGSGVDAIYDIYGGADTILGGGGDDTILTGVVQSGQLVAETTPDDVDGGDGQDQIFQAGVGLVIE